ncbi:hypothetical protein PENTCL1PPCAC_16745, partial [Pristionchus entomophagus]
MLLLLFSVNLPSILCSCFLQSPWTNIRPVLQINSCPTVDSCESACLGNTQCSAYAFVNSKCALLGADSGKRQTCTSPNPTCFVRTSACDATTSTTSTTSITSTTTS